MVLLEWMVPIADFKLPPGMIAYRKDTSTFIGLVLVDDAILNVRQRGKKAMVILRDVERWVFQTKQLLTSFLTYRPFKTFLWRFSMC